MGGLGALRGCNAIVTGASRGLGVHIARELARAGVNLALVARSHGAVTELARELTSTGVKAVAVAADLTDLTRLGAVVSEAEAALGAIDILVNNAGIDGIRVFADERDEQTQHLLQLNLTAPMLLTRKVLPSMLARKRGHVVNVASLAGKTSTPFSVSYAASKAGLVSFSLSLRDELHGTGVSTSVICPGFVSGEGMWAKQEVAHGVRVAALLGTSRPEQVARAVMIALRDDRAEIAVNPGPIRLIQALHQLSPDFVSWFQERMLGLRGMLRNLAIAESAQSAQRGTPTGERR
jgi:short-subunit dehydrogenase